MNRKHIITLVTTAVVLVPMLAFAQPGGGQIGGTATGAFDNLKIITGTIRDIVNLLLPIVFSLAILAFFYGIMVYVFSTTTAAKKNGRDIMLWSLIAIAIMVSLYGIIALAQNTLGINPNQTLQGGSVSAPKVTQ